MSDPLGRGTPIGILLDEGDVGEETAQLLREAIGEDRTATYERAYRRGYEDARALATAAIEELPDV